MSMETYALVVSESDGNEGIAADVYNEAGTIEGSAFVEYAEYGLTVDRADGGPEDRRRETTADMTTLRLEIGRDDAGFQFRVLGDEDRKLLTERVEDEAWGLRER